MARARRRPMHYLATMLHDGTVLAAYPIRRPSRQTFKQDKLRVDPDGVTIEYAESGSQLRDVHNDTRTRFQDLIAANLNTRRAIRAMVLPALANLQSEVRALRAQLDRIEAAIAQYRGA